ncbi:DUF3015 family protein [Hydrogenivirga sp. 128-5-R1-1]|uniref:DUF3015 family protein n=1 Tax=Hydrogenivirga sp. 128-5-R1-1 TaxID=392423 RepID=UPI0002F37690|nr:DUF3015 family protein [Hydrogenivirga sp. 128-5-R1-1]
MRKFLMFIAGAVMLSGASFAVNKSNTGCGLGYVAMKDQEGVVFEVLAVTTNGTSFNQTFGITFGTLECEKPAKFVGNEKLHRFVSENMDELAQDIARGEGRYVETLADLMEVPAEQRPEFYTKLQQNFERIFPSESVSSAHVIDAIATL